MLTLHSEPGVFDHSKASAQVVWINMIQRSNDTEMISLSIAVNPVLPVRNGPWAWPIRTTSCPVNDATMLVVRLTWQASAWVPVPATAGLVEDVT